MDELLDSNLVQAVGFPGWTGIQRNLTSDVICLGDPVAIKI